MIKTATAHLPYRSLLSLMLALGLVLCSISFIQIGCPVTPQKNGKRPHEETVTSSTSSSDDDEEQNMDQGAMAEMKLADQNQAPEKLFSSPEDNDSSSDDDSALGNDYSSDEFSYELSTRKLAQNKRPNPLDLPSSSNPQLDDTVMSLPSQPSAASSSTWRPNLHPSDAEDEDSSEQTSTASKTFIQTARQISEINIHSDIEAEPID
ncbi:hypothetical protein RF11_11610 [Thelohanellus kitauei]|uniref:Uncharacterized protein n=1 Tax=Thelohanellus kitauei TaxID=669202 RepID=A0A0C2JDK4_THEKT|nr:hypothetical protein RF11_11610 [Thelohanellus kitauei]